MSDKKSLKDKKEIFRKNLVRKSFQMRSERTHEKSEDKRRERIAHTTFCSPDGTRQLLSKGTQFGNHKIITSLKLRL